MYHSLYNTVILPITECKVQYEITNYMRYGIHYYDDHYLTFTNEDSLKLHYLNAVHDKMSVGNDGFIETSINGPDVIFPLNIVLLTTFMKNTHQ